MPVPDFILDLRRHVGHAPLWLIGVTAVVVRERHRVGEVLLVQRADTGVWSPVTGIVDPGEDPHVAAIREVAEEALVTAEIDRLVWVSASDLLVHVNGDQARYLDHTFACRWVAGEPAVGDDESVDARWWPVDALPPMPEIFAARVAAVLADEPGVRLGGGQGSTGPDDSAATSSS